MAASVAAQVTGAETVVISQQKVRYSLGKLIVAAGPALTVVIAGVPISGDSPAL